MRCSSTVAVSGVTHDCPGRRKRSSSQFGTLTMSSFSTWWPATPEVSRL